MKQESEDIGLQVKDIAEYVTRQQALDREERAAWRVALKFHAEEKRRADEIRMVEIQAEEEEKKRADELQAEKEKRADEIEIDKELKIREMEFNKLKSPPVLQPLHPLVIKMPSPRSIHPL